MTEDKPARQLPSLRRYLLLWFAGCAIVMVSAYTQLLEYYLELGIELRTQAALERTAEEYADAYTAKGARPTLPDGPSIAGYRDLADVPAHLLAVFHLEKLRHGEVLRFTNLKFDDQDDKQFAVQTFDLCPEGTCELIFFYPYQVGSGEWLYLVQGVVGSEEIYEELEFTDQFAIAVGILFTGLILLASILLIRNIAAPVRKLNDWSAAQSVDTANQAPPNLRFRELDALARRIQFAFERMREGVNKEKLFLRHASHELRTPIAILSSNVELIDRLTQRPERSEAEQAAFVRQYRALEDVQLLMETLLWVNRQSDNLPKSERINLRSELDGIVENYRYYLDTRPVSLTVSGEGEVIATLAAVRIVLSNLVRNAFQHTLDGEVTISVGAGEVSIENASSAGLDTDDTQGGEEYGFGLGLELVLLICQRFDWRCTTTESPYGRTTVVEF